MKIETIAETPVATTSSTTRISAHTHINGLGLDENGDAIVDDASTAGNRSGLVGQKDAREALGIVADLIHSQQLAGRALLLVGPPGTGKVSCAFCASDCVAVCSMSCVYTERATAAAEKNAHSRLFNSSHRCYNLDRTCHGSGARNWLATILILVCKKHQWWWS